MINCVAEHFSWLAGGWLAGWLAGCMLEAGFDMIFLTFITVHW